MLFSAPSVTEDVMVMPLSPNIDLSLQCPIAGAVQRQWLKVTNNGADLPSETSSSILIFEEFSAADQGYYFCEGRGGGNHTNEVAATDPILLILEGKGALNNPKCVSLYNTQTLKQEVKSFVTSRAMIMTK